MNEFLDASGKKHDDLTFASLTNFTILLQLGSINSPPISSSRSRETTLSTILILVSVLLGAWYMIMPT
jgi:hypothetical protein